MHAVCGNEVRGDAVPHVRREGRAVHEHQRRAVAVNGVVNAMPIEAVLAVQQPVSHVPVLLAGRNQKA
ncbi:hypothetical protein D3C84_1187070 [compost metagenome]